MSRAPRVKSKDNSTMSQEPVERRVMAAIEAFYTGVGGPKQRAEAHESYSHPDLETLRLRPLKLALT